jgi:uncharacterized membrane protein YphA (DoxX/SURF4 family)
MKTVKRICAVIIGFVLFGAGILKLMDPVGAGLVVGEYFNFLHIGFLAPVSKAAGVGMALLETLLGAALITGVAPRVTGIVSAVVLGLFTVLTFVLWLVNPAMDCGCFGEAVHLTHGQSLLKNVILCVLWAVAYLPLGATPVPRKVKNVSFLIVTLSVIAFMIYSLVSIPSMDFTPFKPGVTLQQSLTSPNPESPLLSICDAEGDYRDELLASGPVLVLSVYDELPESAAAKLRDAAEEAGNVLKVLLVDAGGMLEGASFSSDRRTLMSLNRSNGGATLLCDGMVTAKWPLRSLPSSECLSELVGQKPAEAMMQQNTPKRLKFQGFLLYVFAVLLLL